MNISSERLEDLLSSSNYIIVPVKDIDVFEPQLWRKAFGKLTRQSTVEAKILHTSNGLQLPIKRHPRSPTRQTLEMAGFYSYDEESELMRELLNDLLEDIQEAKVIRIDVAIDIKGKVPNKVIKSLCKYRKPFKFKNTTYYKTGHEKKSNPRLNIKIYDKAKKANLSGEMERLEFCFQGQYFKNVAVRDLHNEYKKMEKTIKKFTGLTVQIQALQTSL